ncbi:PAS [Pedobacter sp. BAL39]|uniref:sensor histidine kinase n=1 Tax=Pedobacter sp. BAL39 TaxID=391596 RepID=UPI00015594F5|nr:PAS domain-containing sensor histidine kinase [Pedobacter sp. BAL39]EDM37142.1 PAS [Pedobacter sp. BAL39]
MSLTYLNSHQRLLKMVEEIEDYAIVLLDENGNIENWNKGAQKIKGYTAAEIIGKNFSIFYTEADLIDNLPTKLINEAARNEKVTNEGWRIRKDGTRFWGSVLITAIHNEGQVIGFTKIIRDMTAIKETEDALRKSEDRYHKMISEVVDYAIVLLDAEGNIENWNKGAERIKGYLPAEIIGRNFRLFYPPEDRKNKVPDQIIATARDQGRAQQDGWRVRKDGTLFWGSVTITALYDDEGIVTGFSKVTRDLTEKRKSEKAHEEHMLDLSRRNSELEQFTYIASHDLQEPLRTISSFNELLKEQYYEQLDDDGRMFTDMIEQSADRMRNLIHGLLDYTRIGTRKSLTEVNCNAVVQDIEKDLYKLISETNTTIISHPLPVLLGLKMELIQLFQNLISNAIKYRKKNLAPVIEIRAEEHLEHWQFSLSDNGIGMDQRYIHKIFMIFQRLHNRDEYKGNGIGLANCKKIAELHKGDIWVHSVLGEGSTFHFTIAKYIDNL